jgi:hypothetical protein
MANWIFLTAKRSKASETLENILFPEGNIQKRKVIDAFNTITNEDYSNEEILDFFMKEKGLQLISINTDLPPSVKKYIRKDTLIDLNYFERVKFHEVFINYPRNFEVRKIENSETIFNETSLSASLVTKQRLAV